MKGKIHSFQSLGTLDGPGIRFVVFMHGCNLSCGYCHNIDVCRGEYTEYTAEEVFQKVLKYKDYFGQTGGITVSGGEPLLQAEFVYELFKLCSDNGINTALDTSGSVYNDTVSKVLDCCNFVLLDIKMTNNDDYKKYIGCTITPVLEFLDELEKRNISTWIRQVIIHGINDNEENIMALKEIINGKSIILKTELLPFKNICISKYEQMGIDFPFKNYEATDRKIIDRLKKLLV